MAFVMNKNLPAYGMPPAGGVGNKPAYVEPDWDAIFAEMAPKGPEGEGPGGPGGPGDDWPPKNDFINDNEPMVVIQGGVCDNRADDRVKLTGTFDASHGKGVVFETQEKELNGFIIAGDTEYVLEDSKFHAVGDGRNDFGGNGALIMSMDEAQLTLKNMDVETTGVIRPCTFAANNSVLKVYDSVIVGNGGTLGEDYVPVIGPGMKEPPSGLEIGGNCRTHLSVGNSRSYFYNSKIVADGWAALSTDASDGDLYLEANDCEVICRDIGYGTYSDGGCAVVFNRCKVDTATHSAIMAGECSFAMHDCQVKSGKYSVMVHSVMGVTCETADLKIYGGSYDIGEDLVFVKSQNVYVDIDGIRVTNCKNILHSIVNRDECATRVGEDEQVYGVKCAISNCEIAGDILHEDTARSMAVSLYNTKLTGAVQNAYLALDASSSWTAAADSVVALVGAVEPAQLDAPAGVTVSAIACEGCALSGEYILSGGGKLIVA